MVDTCSETELETPSESASDNDFEMFQSQSNTALATASNRKRNSKNVYAVHEHLDRSIATMKNLTKKRTDLWCLALQLTLKKLPATARKEMKMAITSLIDHRYSSTRKPANSIDVKIKVEPMSPETVMNTETEAKNTKPMVDTNSETLKMTSKATPLERAVMPIIWTGTICMVDMVPFGISLSTIYGDASQLVFPLELDVIGRIGPKSVYEYMANVKLTNGIALLRFAPVSKDDESAYKAFVEYLHLRQRFGVIQTRCKLIKDFYILPLMARQSLPSILMPDKDNVDLGANRTDLLLGIVVKATSNRKNNMRSRFAVRH